MAFYHVGNVRETEDICSRLAKTRNKAAKDINRVKENLDEVMVVFDKREWRRLI